MEKKPTKPLLTRELSRHKKEVIPDKRSLFSDSSKFWAGRYFLRSSLLSVLKSKAETARFQ